ncbi:MAG: hypothetical protein R3F61_18740 [Myxococcota bacterium]
MDAVWAVLREAEGAVQAGTPVERWRVARDRFEDPFLAAIFVGRGAETVGQAFFAGYQAAMERSTGERAVQAVLVNEPGPPEASGPAHVRTRLEDGRVSGTKSFALDGIEVGWVLARAGTRVDGRAELVLARIEAPFDGSVWEPIRLPWLVDVPHSRVALDGVPVTEVRPDAWATVVKPFRTVEDLGVLTALASARLGATGVLTEQEAWMAMLAGLSALWRADPDHPWTIRALADLQARFARESEGSVTGPLARSWATDSRLLGIAARAREIRLHRARSPA